MGETENPNLHDFGILGRVLFLKKNCFLKKNDQDPKLKKDYKDSFELD